MRRESSPARAHPDPGPRPPEAAARAATEWLGLLGRTLKICRLYDAGNPTVARFRGQLVESLQALVERHGTLELSFTSREVLIGETVIQSAASREDNVALPFFRDGIRRLSFAPGVDAREVGAILDALLRVTRHDADLEDLLTLLWDAELVHVGLEYVATDGDTESGAGPGAVDPATLAPWPAGGSAAGPGDAAASHGAPGRSDDRETGEATGNVDRAWAGIEAAAEADLERFRREFAASESAPGARRGFELLRDCLAGEADAGTRREIGRFLLRVLHESLGDGAWRQAREILALVRAADPDGWSPDGLVRQLCQPGSITARHALAQLECQSPELIGEFGAFAHDLGPEGFEWVMGVIATSERRQVRQPLTGIAAALVAERPERLAPWLADERWYVVRNAVHVLGRIEGPVPVELLGAVKDHAEPRVRREVAAVAAKHPSREAFAILIEILRAAEGRLLTAVLQELGRRRDPELARALVEMVRDGGAGRPEGETRALYMALAAAADDSVLPELEAHIQNGSWVAAGDDARRFAAAMCVARIPGAAALAVLERGAQSRRANVARACRDALASRRPDTEREAA